MKVIALKTFAGLSVSCVKDQQYDLPADQAKQFIQEGLVKTAKAPAKRQPKAK